MEFVFFKELTLSFCLGGKKWVREVGNETKDLKYSKILTSSISYTPQFNSLEQIAIIALEIKKQKVTEVR